MLCTQFEIDWCVCEPDMWRNENKTKPEKKSNSKMASHAMNETDNERPIKCLFITSLLLFVVENEPSVCVRALVLIGRKIHTSGAWTTRRSLGNTPFEMNTSNSHIFWYLIMCFRFGHRMNSVWRRTHKATESTSGTRMWRALEKPSQREDDIGRTLADTTIQ